MAFFVKNDQFCLHFWNLKVKPQRYSDALRKFRKKTEEYKISLWPKVIHSYVGYLEVYSRAKIKFYGDYINFYVTSESNIKSPNGVISISC